MNAPVSRRELLDRIINDLAGPGWSVCPNFIAAQTTRDLAQEILEQVQDGKFRPAKVGIGSGLKLRPEIRSDHVRWLDETALSTPQQIFFDAIEELRYALNQAMYLGLFEFEAHLTVYPPGACYQRHLDRFRGSEHRVVSCILYLNDDWQADQGGQLRMYPPTGDAPYVDVLPVGGTLACFLSEAIEHEVLAARRDRLSITGWICSRRA